MTTFDDREHGFEAKFAHDADTEFRILARRNRLLGSWAADRQGLSGDAAEAYAKAVVSADFAKPGEEDVLHKVTTDLAAHGLGETDVRAAMAELLVTARHQIMDAL